MRKALFSVLAAIALVAGAATPAAAGIDYAPSDRATVSVNVSASSQAVQLSPNNGTQRVRIFNSGTATAWVRFGCAGVTAATASDIPVPAGYVDYFTVTTSTCATNAAVIAAGATGIVYFSLGSVVR